MYRKNSLWANLLLRCGKKALVLAVAMAVVLTGAIGGTLAWLIDNTDPIVNTFTYGDINIDLTETPTDNDGDNNNYYEMTPGLKIAKDPKITVKADSKDCWLFVELKESENFGDFLEYTVAEGWTKLELDGVEGVYYRQVAESDVDQEFGVLENDTVNVKGDVTKEMLNALTEETYPTLTVTAYAVQYDAEIEAIDTVEEAWALVQDKLAANP